MRLQRMHSHLTRACACALGVITIVVAIAYLVLWKDYQLDPVPSLYPEPDDEKVVAMSPQPKVCFADVCVCVSVRG